MRPIELEGASVAITGAGRGIGRKTAEMFAAAGASVAIGEIDLAAAEEAAAEIGPRVRALPLDVGERDSFAAFLAAAEAEAGPLEVLVNNAGVMPAGRFLEEPDEVTASTIAVNLWGPIWGMKLALPGMIERGSGHIANVASLMGKFYLPGVATYSGAKYGVVGLSAAVRDELDGTGVSITTILPSATQTDLISGIEMPAVMPRVKPEQIAEAVVESCRKRQPEATVPGWLAPAAPLAELAPDAVVGRLRRLLGHDRALDADPSERAAYEARARHPGG